MKKTLFFVFTFLFSLIFFSFHVQASTVKSINWIDPSKFLVVDPNLTHNEKYAKLSIGQSENLSINSGVEYFFLPTYINTLTLMGNKTWEELPMLTENVVIDLYDGTNKHLGEQIISKPLYSNGLLVGFAFSVPSGTATIKFRAFSLISETMLSTAFSLFYENNYSSFDESFLLIEADTIKFLPTNTGFNYNDVRGSDSYDISDLYLGEDTHYYYYGRTIMDQLSPVIDSAEYSYKTTVDNPISLNGLKEAINLVAFDEIDGDLTDEIVISSEAYMNNVYNKTNVKERALGTYQVEFYVEDYSGNSASCTVNLIVEDITKPVLNLGTSTISYIREVDSAPLNLADIKAAITVTDNYSDVSIVKTVDNYSGNEHVLGVFTIIFTYEDSSKNSLDVTVTIENKDTTAPVITSSMNSIEVSYTYKDGLTAILDSMNIKVEDSFEGMLAYEVTEDNYTTNKKYLGEYLIKIKAADSSGNVSEKTLNIKVIDDVNPYFYINNNIVNVQLGVLFNEGDIITTLKTRQMIANNKFTLEIISDEYSDNYNKLGDYELRVRINYDNKTSAEQTLIMRVENPKQVKVTFFAKLWMNIKKIFLWIWNIIKWPFVKLISLF